MPEKPVNEAPTRNPVENLDGAGAVPNEGAVSLVEQLTGWFNARAWIPDGFDKPLALTVVLTGLIAVAWLIYVVIRPLLLRWVKALVKRTPFSWDEKFFGFGVFRWASHLVPALFISAVAPGLFESAPTIATIIVSAARLYMVVAGFFTIDSLLNAGHATYRESELAREFPAGGFFQVAKLITALVALLLAIAILIGKSPLVLLGGLGVFASVLMLVFKDVILGFVAGIQIATNRMLSPGDWLEMPGQGADGEVEEIGLTTVKVRNWDKTFTTIPTYALISQSFRNWRGMKESGGRRIKRSILIDVNSIRLCDDTTLAKFRKIEHISEYLTQKEDEIAAWNKKHGISGDDNRVNGRRLTNVGTFRAYIEAYLRNHPEIHRDMTLLVRQLDPADRGLPIQIYCFTTTTAWAAYEGIQADIFDHLLAVAPEFDLRIFQTPSGADVRSPIAIMEAGAIDTIQSEP